MVNSHPATSQRDLHLEHPFRQDRVALEPVELASPRKTHRLYHWLESDIDGSAFGHVGRCRDDRRGAARTRGKNPWLAKAASRTRIFGAIRDGKLIARGDGKAT